MSLEYTTLRDLTARTGLSKEALRGHIRRGDLHVDRHGSERAVRILLPEAEAFVAFIEATRATAPDPDRARGAYCVGTGHRCACRCHLIRRGMRPASARRPWDAWLPSHDDALRALVADGRPPERCAEVLSERFPVPRTSHAVSLRIRKLGLSRRDGWLSGEDLIRLLGVYRRRIQQFEAQGLLTATHYGRWRRYRLPEVEALVRSQAGLVIDPRRVLDPKLKALAETAAVVNRRRQAGA